MRCLLIILSFIFSLNIALQAQSWKRYQVTFKYDPAFKGGPNKGGPKMNWAQWTKYLNLKEFDTATAWIELPPLEEGDVIRGVMQGDIRDMGALKEFAARNKIAIYESHMVHNPYGGPHKTFLQEAAKVTGHPELAHAGAIIQGVSNKGRFAAHFAHFWPERTLAVILDQSWTSGQPAKKAADYNAGRLPMSLGVPYFFNSSKDDAQGGSNRRLLHYNWCTKAFKQKQPCTSIISYESVKHGRPGDRSLQAAWLEDVLTLRVPAIIPADGSPYELIPINPSEDGGHMSVKIITKGKVSHYTNVKVGAIGQVRGVSWWVPGAKSASLALQWLAKNNGDISQDDSAKIKTQARFGKLSRENNLLLKMLQMGKLNLAFSKFKFLKEPADSYQKQAFQMIKKQLEEEIASMVGALKDLQRSGDRYALLKELKTNSLKLKGIASFDEIVKSEVKKGRMDSKSLAAARAFYSSVERLSRKRTTFELKMLEKIKATYSKSIYGHMSSVLLETLENDLEAEYSLAEIRSIASERL